ncbi:MAG: glycerol-3-phosphate 1-O-acyltransferase PlsY [Clostridia bacterium]|nr:glycerol-3-phosphate 1-O-acyltransferase PlsY [Clostridia bacterium]
MLLRLLLYLAAAAAAYCLGSISTGILVARANNGPDLRKVGSGNTGATNVQRTMGWKWGLITFFGDALKALLACWLGSLITGSHMGALLAGLMVIVGHNWPVFFQFKGGKGVASSCGVMLFCFPLPAVICFALTVGIIAVSKYVSLGSITMLTLFAILVSCYHSGGNLWIIGWAALLAGFCVYRHKANIARLIAGTENRLGTKLKS